MYVPLATPRRVQELTYAAVRHVLKEAGLLQQGRVDENRIPGAPFAWGELDYDPTIGYRLRTLRDRARLVNTLRFRPSGDRRLEVDPI